MKDFLLQEEEKYSTAFPPASRNKGKIEEKPVEYLHFGNWRFV